MKQEKPLREKEAVKAEETAAKTQVSEDDMLQIVSESSAQDLL